MMKKDSIGNCNGNYNSFYSYDVIILVHDADSRRCQLEIIQVLFLSDEIITILSEEEMKKLLLFFNSPSSLINFC